jgi:5-(carboxyamino)imidazole ribonucleotide synthase
MGPTLHDVEIKHLGILGAGQLGRMLALAGYPLGLRIRCFDTSATATAGQVAQLRVGSFKDEAALEEFAAGLDLITYEFENVPISTACYLADRVPVLPPPPALAAAQERFAEKLCFTRLGIPTPPFAPVETLAQLHAAVAQIGLPAVLKTRRFGYDGKGQVVLRHETDIAAAYQQLAGVPLILESFIPFDREVSLLMVRGRNGQLAAYPLVWNQHRLGILRESRAPAPELSPALQARAEDYGRRVLESLDYVGLLAIEFFQVGDQLIANEMAPRVHNSGHWTIEGAVTSQFANHLRAILGLPLGDTSPRGEVAMLNCIGSRPDPARLLTLPGVYLHDYDKEVLPGRKVGHVTVVAATTAELEQRLAALRQLVTSQEIPNAAG